MKPIYFVFLLAVMSLACVSQVATSPAPAVMKAVPPVVPTAQTAKICLSTEQVRLRMGAGTSYAELAILSAGDKVTLLGDIAESDDGGFWTSVQVGGMKGFVNSRYLCPAEVR